MCEPTRLLAALAALAALRAARALDHRAVANRTTCAYEVKLDTDPERIPRNIQTVRCAAEPERACRQLGVEPRLCCAAPQRCVQVTEQVAVFDRRARQTVHRAVPVACACYLAPR